MASWSELRVIILIEEPGGVLWKRVRREFARVGFLRLLDVLAMRLYYRLALAGRDEQWKAGALGDLQRAYPAISASIPIIRVSSPNAAEVQQALTDAQPDLVLALCKNILAERVFSIPRYGTFVLHPGICPEYRNAHGCFWALASDDVERVGATLLRIDKGIDTGPVFAYFRAPFDEANESHIVIQHRMVLDSLQEIQASLLKIVTGDETTIPTTGRRSHEWGQPWLSRYFRWKSRARRRANARPHA